MGSQRSERIRTGWSNKDVFREYRSPRRTHRLKEKLRTARPLERMPGGFPSLLLPFFLLAIYFSRILSPHVVPPTFHPSDLQFCFVLKKINLFHILVITQKLFGTCYGKPSTTTHTQAGCQLRAPAAPSQQGGGKLWRTDTGDRGDIHHAGAAWAAPLLPALWSLGSDVSSGRSTSSPQPPSAREERCWDQPHPDRTLPDQSCPAQPRHFPSFPSSFHHNSSLFASN